MRQKYELNAFLVTINKIENEVHLDQLSLNERMPANNNSLPTL